MTEHRISRFIAPLLLCSAAWLLPGSSEQVARAVPPGSQPEKEKDDTPAIDPKAFELLRQSTARIKSFSRFSVHAEATRDVVVRDDFKVQTMMSERVTVQHNPDRMRAEQSGDDGRRVFVYDGKSVRIYAAPENYYADIPGAGTLARTYEAVSTKYGIDFPLGDLLFAASGGDLSLGVTDAAVLRPSRIDGVECDHLAFRSPKMDFQIWIDRTGNQLPRKFVMTTRDEPTAPQFEAVLTWDISPKLAESDFAFELPKGATPIRVLEADAIASSED